MVLKNAFNLSLKNLWNHSNYLKSKLNEWVSFWACHPLAIYLSITMQNHNTPLQNHDPGIITNGCTPTSFRSLVILSLVVVALSVLFFDAYVYDVLAYHAPFSILSTKIDGYTDVILPSDLLERYKGFAPLWRYALYPSLALGLPRLMIVPNIAALCCMCYTLNRVGILKWHLSIASIFSFPILLFSFRSGYQDFFVGAIIATSLILMMFFLFRQNLLGASIPIALLCLASYTKYQGFFQSTLVLFVSLIGLLLSNLCRRPRSGFTRNAIFALSFGFILISAHSLYNFFHYHNPFYPISTTFFSGPEQNYTASPSYTSFLHPISGLINQFFSASELDWIFRGVVPSFTIDMARSQIQYGGVIDPTSANGLVRTGGAFGPAYLFFFSIYLVGLSQTIKKLTKRIEVSPPEFAYVSTSIYLLLASLLPQSHELRYYLSSLILVSVFALYQLIVGRLYSYSKAFLLIFFTISICLNFVQPVHSTFKHGIAYALDYPTRDLPKPIECKNSKHIINDPRMLSCLYIKMRPGA